ncbi:coiled-coil domain-containing protein 55-domain containing protein [Thamnidium elegans]|nr:coiled-coil domain-containing protein 55-domain containing protein [Thamnidium elegans]
MQRLNFGLNLQKKKAATGPIRRANAFGDDSDEDEEEEVLEEKQGKKSSQKAKAQVNRQLSNYNTMTKKIAQEQAKALEEDPNIFDYDAVYDDLKEVEKKKKEAVKPTTKKAKYITGLLEMAEIRKRDRVLAEEKKVARERAEEGDEFADKDVFVTEAFKKQKEELERIEREEKERETLADKKRGMDSFYKQVLERKEAEHQAMMKAIAEKAKNRKNNIGVETTTEIEPEQVLLKQAEKEGKEVMVNDNNEIVDKRQLLGAGLNVKPKFGTLGSLASSDERIKERMDEYEEYKRKKVEEYESKRKQGKNNDERERMSKEMERQLMEAKRKEKEEEERKQKEFEQKVAVKRTTEDVAMSAKERYLARKKQKLEETKK